MSEFDRSSYMRERHALARSQRQFYSKQTGKTGDYHNFLKKGEDNPLYTEVVAYHVEFKQDYENAKGHEFNIEREDFIVYMPIQYSKGDLEEEVRQNISGIFNHPKKVNAVYSGKANLTVDVDELRGMEKAERPKLTKEIIDDLNERGYYTSKSPKVKINNGKKSKTYDYDLNVFK